MNSSRKVVGFTNPLHLQCGLLVTLVHENSAYWAIYPDNTKYRLKTNSDDFSTLDTYIPSQDGRSFDPGHLSYLSQSGQVFSGSEKLILAAVRSDQTNVKDTFLREVLKNIETELEYTELTQYKAQHVPSTFYCFSTIRKKRNGQFARRLFIQCWKNGSYKTHFRKNLNGLLIDSEKLGKKITLQITNSINNTAHVYKTIEPLKFDAREIFDGPIGFEFKTNVSLKANIQ